MLAEPHHLRACGLPNVYLLNGVETEDDAVEGTIVTIENMRGLYHALALHIIGKHGPMTGPEFRFLRKMMRLTQGELSERMSVTDQTIANYEKEKTAPGSASAHMRLLAIIDIMPQDSGSDMVKKVAEKAESVGVALTGLRMERIVEGWRETRKRAA